MSAPRLSDDGSSSSRGRDAPYPSRRPEDPEKLAMREYNRERDRGERPTRVLFVRNINYTVPEEEIRKLFEQFGDIHKTFMMIPTRGIAFVTYFDIRSAMKAKRHTQATRFIDRAIDVHFSLPRESRFGVTEEQCTTSAINARLLGAPDGVLSEERAHSFFSQYGDIRDVRASRSGQPDAKTIEFYDFRDCEAAISKAPGVAFDGGVWAEIGYCYASRIEQVLDDETRDQIRRDLERERDNERHSHRSSSGSQQHHHHHGSSSGSSSSRHREYFDEDDHYGGRSTAAAGGRREYTQQQPPLPAAAQAPAVTMPYGVPMMVPAPGDPAMPPYGFDPNQMLSNPMFAAAMVAMMQQQQQPQQQQQQQQPGGDGALCFVGPDGQPIFVGGSSGGSGPAAAATDPYALPSQAQPDTAAATQRARDPRLSSGAPQ